MEETQNNKKRTRTSDSFDQKRETKRIEHSDSHDFSTSTFLSPEANRQSANMATAEMSTTDVEPEVPFSQLTSTPVNTNNPGPCLNLPTMIETFGELFHAALTDPRTTSAMRNMFKPLMVEQTQEIKTEIQTIKNELRTQGDKVQFLEKKVEDLNNVVSENQARYNNMEQTLEHQQRFLENIDYGNRKNSIIITGIPEDEPLIINDNPTGNNDTDKVTAILQKLEHRNIQTTVIQRIGQKNETRPRPIKITLQDANDRLPILKSSNKLKEETGQLKKIYVNKDTHPGIRREENRLRTIVKQERMKPENIGRSINYDRKEKCVKVDDMVIDTFKPTFF